MPRVDLDDYELGPVIGTGTVGTIYRVVEKKNQRVAALKLLSIAVSANDLIATRFSREMMILEKLHHPHIVTYFGGGKHEGRLFYVMELVEGGTIKELLLESGPFPWGEAAEVGRQVSSALQYAHNHGIIHRDLKPGNIFLTLEGVCKLGDFGIARDMHAADLTDAGLTVGTYAYMAPELVRGRREMTGKVDLYALGCVLFEMLTGNPPYLGDNFAEIFEQHLHAEPPSVRSAGVDCPPELDVLIRSLLAKDPEQRPFNAREVQGRLGELCDVPTSPLVEPEEAPATVVDLPAQSVGPFQESLSHRIAGKQPTPVEVSWGKLAWLALVVAVVVGVAAWRQAGSSGAAKRGDAGGQVGEALSDDAAPGLPPATQSSAP